MLQNYSKRGKSARSTTNDNDTLGIIAGNRGLQRVIIWSSGIYERVWISEYMLAYGLRSLVEDLLGRSSITVCTKESTFHHSQYNPYICKYDWILRYLSDDIMMCLPPRPELMRETERVLGAMNILTLHQAGNLTTVQRSVSGLNNRFNDKYCTFHKDHNGVLPNIHSLK